MPSRYLVIKCCDKNGDESSSGEDGDSGNVRGVFAKCNIPAKTRIIQIPEKHLITKRHILETDAKSKSSNHVTIKLPSENSKRDEESAAVVVDIGGTPQTKQRKTRKKNGLSYLNDDSINCNSNRLFIYHMFCLLCDDPLYHIPGKPFEHVYMNSLPSSVDNSCLFIRPSQLSILEGTAFGRRIS